ncbi:cupin domain-containing protein [Leptospira kemamanensis]|uniref:Cupin domain-containing protein n=1 Tax=Leptospira kemamanensis TaxID=2484942 RepID=A0A4R9JVZ7_9LEPT|nr:cupin domain-containing protein [Leptospira kemamanensis]TGL55717.1 cupin domain-containing protein [Leptospira kemamanensis]
MGYIHQKNPTIIPVPGNKTIEEHFGIPSNGTKDISIAHMVAPPGWGEPFQTPNFDEWTLMVRGKKQIEVDGETLVLSAGESILIQKGTRVRYSNPFQEDAEYWSVCKPAFTIDAVNREEE